VRRAGTAIDVDSLSTSEIDDSDIDSDSEGISLVSVVENKLRIRSTNQMRSISY
jgi:hypothetical protein